MDTSALPRPWDGTPQRQPQPAHKQLLALDPSLGTVYICERCQHLHIDLGKLHFKTDLEGFQSLLVLLSRAAANYELWGEQQGSLT